MMKTCRACYKGEYKRLNDGTVKLICKDTNKEMNGFSNCRDFSDKQCTLCGYESEDYALCEICVNNSERPYFKLKK